MDTGATGLATGAFTGEEIGAEGFATGDATGLEATGLEADPDTMVEADDSAGVGAATGVAGTDADPDTTVDPENFSARDLLRYRPPRISRAARPSTNSLSLGNANAETAIKAKAINVFASFMVYFYAQRPKWCPECMWIRTRVRDNALLQHARLFSLSRDKLDVLASRLSIQDLSGMVGSP